ncbi:MAG: hypothetical protein KME11_01810 [Timaviella obliquedivisa GSE-PSE-MK23-08B]|nr:hypothetical protein [Timaviella obliquedivisa GSE-PSE-MK23-08B]
MSSSQNNVPQSPKAASSENKQANASAAPPPKPTASPEIIMDQHLKSTLVATPPAPPTPLEVMSSTAPDQAESAVAPLSTSTTESIAEDSPQPTILRQQPIPPASEPMQYRAIGLVRGKYVATEDQFTKGNIITDDGAAVDAVLLGRVMSLVKKHINLEQSHLWVVYPRTRENVEGLHVQIVGVWEPEKLNRSEAPGDTEAVNGEPTTEPAIEPQPELGEPDDKYFSVRGEVVFQSPDDRKLLVKIRRAPQQGSDESKIFKVSVQGVLEGKVVGYFWDLQVERQDNNLVLREGTRIGIVPPQKRSASDSGRGNVRRNASPRRGSFSPPRREGGSSQRPIRTGERSEVGDRPKPITSQPASQPNPQFSKPIKRSKEVKPENSSVQPES